MELVAEIGPANGDLQYALDAVHAAKEAGFHYVKGQVYDRDLLTSKTAKTYAQKGVSVPELQYDDFGKQLAWGEWEKVAGECERIGIGFFFSVFDLDGLRFGEALGVKRYKIASGDVTFKQLVQAVASMGKLVILSTGASTENEIRRAVGWVTERNTNLIVLACHSAYPTKPHEAQLARMRSIRPIWPEVGYSDHTFGVGAIHRAHHLGAVMVEKHFTITPGAGGDHDFAVSPKQLQHIVEWDTGDPIYDGDGTLEPTEAEGKALKGARRSLHALYDIPQGDLLSEGKMVALRPGGGLEPWEADDYVGRPLMVDVVAGTRLDWSMF
jgi:sialic acid synthase SpsE